MSTQGLFNNTTTTTSGDDTQHVVEVDKVQVNVFFDGTLNNAYNIKAPDDVKGQVGGDGTSYANGQSNVARMWQALGIERDSTDLIFYVEGMGTTKYQKDSFSGYVAGKGETGIAARVEAAFEPLVVMLRRKRGRKGPPAILEVNAFGFSRGAAAARLFVHRVQQESKEHKFFVDDWSKVILQVNFVGLFDTVSSHGYLSYTSDVQDLHLQLDASRVNRVFHVVALDEYRANFSCTNVHSTVQKGKGYEIGIPGAHSDVGGGYTSDLAPEPEHRDIGETRVERDGEGEQTIRGTKTFVYDKGWYGKHNATPTFLRGLLHQRKIEGDYYKVGLSLMVDAASKYTTANYPPNVTAPCKVPAIESVRTQLRAAAKGEREPHWVLDDHLGADAARTFRNRYLHMSFQEGSLAHGPRFTNDTELERQIVPA
jgi:hypothetical protein